MSCLGWMSLCAINGRGNEYLQTFVSCSIGPEATVLHSAVGISHDFGTVCSCLCLSSTEQFSRFRVRARTCDGQGGADACIVFRVGRCWICCMPNCVEVYSAICYKEKSYRQRPHRTGMGIRLLHTFIERWHFCSKWQWYCQWHKLLAYRTCSPQVYREPQLVAKTEHPISIKTLPYIAFWPLTPSTRVDTDNRHWLMHFKRIWHCACSPQNKETRTKFMCWICNIGLCATPCSEVKHTQLHFWGSTDTKMENQNTPMSENITIVITELIFSVAFSWWNKGGEKVWILQKEVYEGTETCWKAFMCVCVFASLHQYKEKIRNTAWRCL